jgi:DNA-binding Lrp family transcriptional regulator
MSEAIMYSRNGQHSQPKMLRAYVLIQTEQGTAIDVAESIAGIDGVATACAVNGPYDVIALAKAVDIDDLCQAIVGKIQTVYGITRTLTCPTVRT